MVSRVRKCNGTALKGNQVKSLNCARSGEQSIQRAGNSNDTVRKNGKASRLEKSENLP